MKSGISSRFGFDGEGKEEMCEVSGEEVGEEKGEELGELLVKEKEEEIADVEGVRAGDKRMFAACSTAHFSLL